VQARAREIVRPLSETTDIPTTRAPVKPEDRYDHATQYPSTPWPRVLRNVVLAVLMAVGVTMALLRPPSSAPRKMHVTETVANPRTAPTVPDVPRCAAGQDSGCVGGRAVVIMAPLAEPSAVPTPAPSSAKPNPKN
jgi:hypothetical protein